MIAIYSNMSKLSIDFFKLVIIIYNFKLITPPVYISGRPGETLKKTPYSLFQSITVDVLFSLDTASRVDWS